MEFYFIKYFFIIIILLKIQCNLIVLPIQIKEITEKNNQNFIYTSFYMGEPQQKIEAEINFQNSSFFMSSKFSNSINSTYNLSSSQTFSIISNNISIDSLEEGYIAEDNFYFYSDLYCQTTKKYDSIPVIFPQTENRTLSPKIGLQIENKNKSLNFINILKYKNITSNYYWTIKFSNLNEGLIIIGDLPHIYDSKNYQKNKLEFTNTHSIKNKLYWGINIPSIKINRLTISDNMIGKIEPKILEIFGSYEYITYIEKIYFQNYYDKQICRRIWDIIEGIDVFRFVCEKDKFNKSDISEFPPLTLVNIDLNYSFEFTGEELFQEKDEKIIFQVVAKSGRTDGEWVLGRIFLLKYQIIFDNENNLVGIYKLIEENIEKQNNKNKRNLYILLIIILIILLLFLITVFIYMIYNKRGICKNRKKRISELDDEFVYIPKE